MASVNRSRPRRYLHWPVGMRRAHGLAIALVPILLATGVALYLPQVHTILIPYLQAILDVHIALGLLWLALLLWPVVIPPRFAGRRTLSLVDWFPLLALGVGAALTGIILVLPTIFSALWREIEFTGHGLFAIALAAAVALHMIARWSRYVARNARFEPERRTFAQFAVYGIVGALLVPWFSRLPGDLERAANVPTTPADVEGEFVTYSAAGYIPNISRDKYRLTVDGAVDNPYTLTFEELEAVGPVERTRNFQCVTGWVVPDVKWKGILLSDLVAKAGPKGGNHVVELYSSDGVYTDTLAGDQIDLSDVLLAYEIEGTPLPAERGGPVRLVVPEMYGYKSVKWVHRLRITSTVEPGYWEVRGYPINAWINGNAPPESSYAGSTTSSGSSNPAGTTNATTRDDAILYEK
jgi:DMSO/TMAO reductase YedYZ molybdopterin-dependent catalytic subunit